MNSSSEKKKIEQEQFSSSSPFPRGAIERQKERIKNKIKTQGAVDWKLLSTHELYQLFYKVH